MRKLALVSILCCLAASAFGQKIRVTSGKLTPLMGENEIGIVFTYNDMQVGKLREADYVERKVEEYNKKEPGRGDVWLQAWVSDRKERFEPKFLELFDKYMADGAKNGTLELVENGTPKYTFVVNTYFTEPGFNIGIVRMNASITLDIAVMENESGEKIARVIVENASANSFTGLDFDTGFRIQECYAKAGREFAKFLIRSLKL